MNYFAHADPFLTDPDHPDQDPYLVVATGVPDMLTVVDRSVRLRQRQTDPYRNDPDPILASVARGVSQHLADDAQFHRTEIFAKLSLEMTITIRDQLDEEPTSFRPRFLGHILVEMLLDATLIARSPKRLEWYYAALESVDSQKIEDAVNRMASRSTDHLTTMIEAIPRVRFLSDYADDCRLWMRINQVMNRAKLEPLPERPFCSLLPEARNQVAHAADLLLRDIPTKNVREISTKRAG